MEEGNVARRSERILSVGGYHGLRFADLLWAEGKGGVEGEERAGVEEDGGRDTSSGGG